MEAKSTFVVVGASPGGVGFDLANKLLQLGHDVIAIVPTDALARAVKDTGLLDNNQLTVLICDVTSDTQVATAAELITEMHPGGVDGVIHLAAVWTEGAIRDTNPDETEWAIGVNALGAANVARRFTPLFATNGAGRFVVFASTAAVNAAPTRPIYAATKAFVLSLCRSITEDLVTSGILVTCVMPGPIASEFYERAGEERNMEGWLTLDEITDVVITLLEMPPNVVPTELKVTPKSRIAG